MKFSLLLCFYGDISLLFELVCKMYFTHSPPLSLCWYDRLLYELWIHDLCLNPSSTSQDVFYAETCRHSPPPGHAATWQPSDHVTGCHEPRDSGDPASCNELPGPCYNVTSPDHATLSHTAEIHIWNVENYFDTTFVVNCFIRNRTSNTEIGRVLFQCYKSYFR